MAHISESYSNGSIKGWLGEDLARSEWNLVGSDPIFKKFTTMSAATRKFQMWRVARKVLGRDILNYNQEIGDCVGEGARGATNYTQCCEILINGDAERFVDVHASYFYGTGRVFVGKGQFDRQGDGSLGSWQAIAVVKYGALPIETPNCPKYSGKISRLWGNSPGPPKEFVEVGKTHLIKSAVKINSWEELVIAITNGYACTIASSQGFEMEAGSDGFHDARGNWEHQMSIIGIDDEHVEPYAEILNSWSDVHGKLYDFVDKEQLPVGMLRAKRRIIERMISQGDCYAYSQYDGVPEQHEILERNMFKFA